MFIAFILSSVAIVFHVFHFLLIYTIFCCCEFYQFFQILLKKFQSFLSHVLSLPNQLTSNIQDVVGLTGKLKYNINFFVSYALSSEFRENIEFFDTRFMRF